MWQQCDDGWVMQVRNDGGGALTGPPTFGREKHVLRRFESLGDSGLTFRYSDMKPGDCLVMGQHQLHMSDPRPHCDGRSVDRRALSVRVILKPPGCSSSKIDMDYSCPTYAGKGLPRVLIRRTSQK